MRLRPDLVAKLTQGIVILAATLLLAYPLQYLFNFLTLPYPLELRDAASISAAIDFSKGLNPYSIQNFPGHIYLYGFLYPLLEAPFVNLFKHPILVARIIDFVFLILLLAISFRVFRKRKASIIASGIGVLILLNSTCFVWSINGSRSDVPGLFFAVLGFAVLVDGELSPKRILISSLCCVISFYIKQYMLFSAVVVAATLTLFVSKQKGYLFVGATMTLGLGSFLLVQHFFPLYYQYAIGRREEFVLHSTTAQMLDQTSLFLRYYWLLWLLYLVHLYTSISSFGFLRLKAIRLKVSESMAPLITGVTVDLFDVGILVSALILTFWLGRNVGNYYTYYGELLLPPLLYVTIPKIDEVFKTSLHRHIVYALILALIVFPLRASYATDFTAIQRAFSILGDYADRCTNIYDQTSLITLYKIDHRMEPLYNNGHTEYAHYVIPVDGTFERLLSPYPPAVYRTNLDNWTRSIQLKLQNKEFDCIFAMTRRDIENYKMIRVVRDVLGRTVYVWIPRSP